MSTSKKPVAFIVDDNQNRITSEVAHSLKQLGYDVAPTITSEAMLNNTFLVRGDIEGEAVMAIASDANARLIAQAENYAENEMPVIGYMAPMKGFDKVKNNLTHAAIFHPNEDMHMPHWNDTIQALLEEQKKALYPTQSVQTEEQPAKSARVDEPHRTVKAPDYSNMSLAQLQALENGKMIRS